MLRIKHWSKELIQRYLTDFDRKLQHDALWQKHCFGILNLSAQVSYQGLPIIVKADQ